MGNSLFDQLKKSGLVDEKKAKQAKHEQYKKRKANKGGDAAADEAKRLAQRVQAEKAERDRRLNQQRKAEAERKAITAQIRQLIETNRIEERDGELAYNFTDGSTIKRLNLNEAVHKQLSADRLAIVRLDETYELVPKPVAEKIKQRDPGCIIENQTGSQSEPEDDDPYADYKVPDDLMW